MALAPRSRPHAAAGRALRAAPAAAPPANDRRQASRRGEVADGRHRLSRRPSPASRRFVSVGDKVTAGQTLLIIEAMKTFNPIKAPKAGTVAQILIDNAQPVEFGAAADDRRVEASARCSTRS